MINITSKMAERPEFLSVLRRVGFSLSDLFDAEIQPEQNKQLVPKHYQHSL